MYIFFFFTDVSFSTILYHRFKIPEICKPAPNGNGKLFNPNTQLGLLASPKCLNCPYDFLWEVYAYDYEYEDTAEQGWRILDYLGDFIEGMTYCCERHCVIILKL